MVAFNVSITQKAICIRSFFLSLEVQSYLQPQLAEILVFILNSQISTCLCLSIGTKGHTKERLDQFSSQFQLTLAQRGMGQLWKVELWQYPSLQRAAMVRYSDRQRQRCQQLLAGCPFLQCGRMTSLIINLFITGGLSFPFEP